ncbi:Uncharacterised protein [Cedecea neteri]|uniref:Uncharacterized protein n=1 Tax=Cedecea neteri TaxID=158822 RepID=A0A2X2TBC4_9ENTR|nr:Uncharacterised protein [Cedecea neteri]
MEQFNPVDHPHRRYNPPNGSMDSGFATSGEASLAGRAGNASARQNSRFTIRTVFSAWQHARHRG